MPTPKLILLTAVLLAGAGGAAIAQQDTTAGAATSDPQQQRSGPSGRPGAASPGATQSLDNSNPASGPTLPGGVGTPPAAAPGSPGPTPPATAPGR